MAKITYEQLDQDAVAEGLHEGLEWTQRHRNLLIAIGVIIVALVTIIGLTRWNNARKTEQVNVLMGQALVSAQKLEQAQDADSRAAALKELEETVKSITDGYAGHPLATEGLYLMGNAFYRQDDFSKAQEFYTQYVAAAETNEQRARGEIALGYAAENESFLKTEQGSQQQLDKLKEAQQHYEKVLTLVPAGSYLHYYGLLCKARMLELTNQNEPAIAIYKQIITERPGEKSNTPIPADQLNGFEGMLIKEIREREGLVSFASTAQLRLDRLTATEQVAPITQPAAGPVAPAEDGAETAAEGAPTN